MSDTPATRCDCCRLEHAAFEDLRSWLAARPPDVRRLALRFPPGCEVRATMPIEVAGIVRETLTGGIVVSYGEGGATMPEWIGVVGTLEGEQNVKVRCSADQIEVVRESPDATREMLQVAIDALGGPDTPELRSELAVRYGRRVTRQ